MQIATQTFTIRPVREDETPAILEVYHQSEDFLALGPHPQASVEMVAADLAESRRLGAIFCGIYTLQGQMIGVLDYLAGGYEGNPKHAFLLLLMIARPYRGSGIGSEVVRLLEEHLRTATPARVILSAVQANNPEAIRFWQRHGYQITGGPELRPDLTSVYHLRKNLSRTPAPAVRTGSGKPG